MTGAHAELCNLWLELCVCARGWGVGGGGGGVGSTVGDGPQRLLCCGTHQLMGQQRRWQEAHSMT